MPKKTRKKAQATALVGLILLVIIFYILFLPPEDRKDLLESEDDDDEEEEELDGRDNEEKGFLPGFDFIAIILALTVTFLIFKKEKKIR